MAGPVPFTADKAVFDRSARGTPDLRRGPRLAGIITELITPFRGDRIDEDAFVSRFNRQVVAGVQGVVVASAAGGERPTLRGGEAARLIDLAVHAARGRIKVIADAASNSTASTQVLVEEAQDLGSDAVILAPPWYNRPSQEGILQHFEAIAGKDGPPILIWDRPKRTSLVLSLPTLQRLSELPRIAGIVDATGDMARVSALRRSCPDWSLLCGDVPPRWAMSRKVGTAWCPYQLTSDLTSGARSTTPAPCRT